MPWLNFLDNPPISSSEVKFLDSPCPCWLRLLWYRGEHCIWSSVFTWTWESLLFVIGVCCMFILTEITKYPVFSKDRGCILTVLHLVNQPGGAASCSVKLENNASRKQNLESSIANSCIWQWLWGCILSTGNKDC